MPDFKNMNSGNNMVKVIELVHFKLVQGITQADFLKFNHNFETCLQSQPGMLYRSLCISDDTQAYIDIVYWQSIEKANMAREAISKSKNCQPFINAIEITSVLLDRLSILSQCNMDIAIKTTMEIYE